MEIMLHVTLDIVQTSPISDMLIETGVALNIDRANVDATSGEILIDVDDNKMGPVCDAFKKRGVVVFALSAPVMRDEDWSVPMDGAKCIQCGTCINMYPHQALSLND